MSPSLSSALGLPGDAWRMAPAVEAQWRFLCVLDCSLLAVGQHRRIPHPVTCDLLHLLLPPLFLSLEMISCSCCKMSPGFRALTAKELVGWHVVSGVTALTKRGCFGMSSRQAADPVILSRDHLGWSPAAGLTPASIQGGCPLFLEN